MRLPLIPSLALATTLALPAFAADPAKKPAGPKVVCMTNGKDGSRAVQGTDLVIEAGEQVKDVVAVDGDVIIRKGAVVEDAVALRGRVIVEPGAHVKGDAVALGGEVRVQGGGHVDGDAVSLGGRLTVDKPEDVKGDRVGLSLEIGGQDLVRGFIEKALDKDVRCHILDDNDKDV
jgi:NDP-sugar pyrophosphorylase family protein